MASSGSFSFGCSAAGPLLPPPSFSFPSQPAASSFPFTNDPAPTPSARSYMWDTSMMSALPEHSQTEVHFCAYGGARRKRTVLKGTPTWLQNLCRTCDGSHSHAPWKDSCGTHTAEEAAYPLPFCQAICLCLRDSLPPHSRARPLFLGQALPHWRDDALFLRAAVKFQPRSWVFPNLPSPFDLQLFPRSLFDAAWLRGKRLPAGPWPKGSVLPLHPPRLLQISFGLHALRTLCSTCIL